MKRQRAVAALLILGGALSSCKAKKDVSAARREIHFRDGTYNAGLFVACNPTTVSREFELADSAVFPMERWGGDLQIRGENGAYLPAKHQDLMAVEGNSTRPHLCLKLRPTTSKYQGKLPAEVMVITGSLAPLRSGCASIEGPGVVATPVAARPGYDSTPLEQTTQFRDGFGQVFDGVFDYCEVRSDREGMVYMVPIVPVDGIVKVQVRWDVDSAVLTVNLHSGASSGVPERPSRDVPPTSPDTSTSPISPPVSATEVSPHQQVTRQEAVDCSTDYVCATTEMTNRVLKLCSELSQGVDSEFGRPQAVTTAFLDRRRAFDDALRSCFPSLVATRIGRILNVPEPIRINFAKSGLDVDLDPTGASGKWIEISNRPLLPALASALTRLRALGVSSVRIRYLTRLNSKKGNRGLKGPTRHSFGDAADMEGFVVRGEYIPVTSWHRADAQLVLRRIADELCKDFDNCLTPQYDSAHGDHFHCHLLPGGKQSQKAATLISAYSDIPPSPEAVAFAMDGSRRPSLALGIAPGIADAGHAEANTVVGVEDEDDEDEGLLLDAEEEYPSAVTDAPGDGTDLSLRQNRGRGPRKVVGRRKGPTHCGGR